MLFITHKMGIVYLVLYLRVLCAIYLPRLLRKWSFIFIYTFVIYSSARPS